MKSGNVLAIGLLVLGLAAGGCKEREALVPVSRENMVAAEDSDPAFMHPHYRFRIDGLDNRWKILPTDEASQLIPDAAGGAMRVGGLFGAVIVEPLGDVDPDDYVELLISNMRVAIADLEPGEVREVDFHGREARRTSLDGTVGGVKFHYEILAFLHQGHGYQVLCWHCAGDGKTHPLDEFFDAVGVVSGKVTPPPVEPPHDFIGAGRRIEGGRFESPVYRLAATGSHGWQLMGETETQQANPDAEFGMRHAASGCYMVVITEQLAGMSAEAYHELTVGQGEQAFREIGPVKKLEPTTMTVGGRSVEFGQLLVDGALPLRIFLGSRVDDDIGYQFQAWHFEQKEGSHAEVIAAGFGGVEFMAKEVAEAKVAELLDMPDMQSAVGPGFSLRNRVFRDFRNGIEWAAPRGIWRFATGDMAAAENPAASLVAADISTGLFVQLISEPAADWKPGGFHDAVLSTYPVALGKKPDKPVTMQVDGQTLRHSETLQALDEGEVLMRVASAIHDGFAHQILVWGFRGVMERESAQVDAALRGFRFPGKKLVPVSKGSNSYTDHRVGFELTVPGSGWKRKEGIQPVLDPVGNSVQWDKNGEMILVLAINMGDNHRSGAIIKRMVGEMLKVNFDRSSRSGASEETTLVAGCKAHLIRVKNPDANLRALTFSDRGTMFLVLVGGEKTSRADELLNAVKRGFRLLD